MKRLSFRIIVLFVTLFVFNLTVLAAPTNWKVIYQTDFSSDPGWITNNSVHYYWDAVTGTYYGELIDGSQEYSYKLLPILYEGASWRFEYDYYPVSINYPGDRRLSLLTPDMMGWDIYDPPISSITLNFQYVLGGSQLSVRLQWTDSGGNGDVWSNFANYSNGIWYHNVVEWSQDTGTLYASVVRKDNGMLIGETTASIEGSFTGIDRIAFSTVGDDYEPDAFGIGYYDNIVVSQSECIPAPGAVLLGTIGAGLVGWLRRHRTL